MDQNQKFVESMLKSAQEKKKPSAQFMQADPEEVESIVKDLQKKIQQG